MQGVRTTALCRFVLSRSTESPAHEPGGIAWLFYAHCSGLERLSLRVGSVKVVPV